MPAEDAPDFTLIQGLGDLQSETTGDARICIAILDGAVALDDPSFAHAQLSEVDILGRGIRQGNPLSSHATTIANILFGNRFGPTPGIAPSCRGIVIPLYKHTDEQYSCTQEELASAIMEAIRQGAHIINVSGGEFSGNGTAGSLLSEAVRACHETRRLLVAAAGNEGCDSCLHVPGALPNVLAVGAMDKTGEPLPHSNWGSAYRQTAVLALGTSTSFATPIVSGVAALLLSLQLKLGMKPNPSAVRDIIIHTSSGCPPPFRETGACGRLLAGRLDISASVSVLIQGVSRMIGATDNSPSQELVQSRLEHENNMTPSSTVFPNSAIDPSATHNSGHRTVIPEGVKPSDCGCGGIKEARQLVYVIGDRIDYDFGTSVRQRSMENHYATTSRSQRESTLNSPSNLLRYLFGFIDEPIAERKPRGRPNEVTSRQGNFYEAKSVYWVLYQGDCPRYVLIPHGFDEVSYKAIIYFYIESLKNEDFCAALQGVDLDIFDDFFRFNGGRMAKLKDIYVHNCPPPHSPQSASQAEIAILFGEAPTAPSHIAVAGEVVGKVRLASGDVVDVLCPELRGMSSWNTTALIDVIWPETPDDHQKLLRKNYIRDNPKVESETQSQFDERVDAFMNSQRDVVVAFVALIQARLYSTVLNDGKAPADRAKNWAATGFYDDIRPFLSSPIFVSQLGGLQNAAVNDIGVVRGNCLRSGGEYDVEIALYNTQNTLQGLTILASTVDVSDIVPTTVNESRYYTRR